MSFALEKESIGYHCYDMNVTSIWMEITTNETG